ncbi:MAG: hypothetical protein EAX96_08095 [Candidatus Lokiarchaeota archaeon]|nr:hypothetical protein [Candidatus Lokiarchaeota archaeon]
MEGETNYKIIVAGLDNSGKTSMILSLENKKSQIASIKPTAGIDRSDLKALGFPIILFDLGGQKPFRDQYLKDDKILYKTDILFFLIDMMDRNRFADSIEYLEKLLEMIDNEPDRKEKAPLIICLHKCDPDRIQDPESYIHSNIQIFKKLLKRAIQRPYKTFETTIFDYSSLVAAFSAGISNILPRTELIETYFEDFLKTTKSDAIVLLDRDGLVLFELFRDEKAHNLAQICGIQFALLSENLQRYEISYPSTIEAEIDGWTFFRTLMVDNITFYLCVVSKTRKNFESIHKNLDNFTEGIKKTLGVLLSP